MILRECTDNNLRFGVEEIFKFELDSKVLNGVVELAFVDFASITREALTFSYAFHLLLFLFSLSFSHFLVFILFYFLKKRDE